MSQAFGSLIEPTLRARLSSLPHRRTGERRVRSGAGFGAGCVGKLRNHALVRFVLTPDVEEFAARVEAFLGERVERNVLATVLLSARRGRFAGHTPLFAYGLDVNGQVCAAALRTPPRPLLTSELDAPAAGALVERWMAEDPGLPGVSGQPATARAIAAAWTRVTGGRSHCRMRLAMHSLTDVSDPPQPARGGLRLPTDAEREILIGWESAFAVQAGVGAGDDAARAVTTRLAHGAQLVWDDDGAVSTVALSPAIGGTVRVGPVYTPPEHRRRGYASSAVAAASRRALDTGAQRCMLFTDLANPTSNKIYAAIGFSRFADWEAHAFAD